MNTRLALLFLLIPVRLAGAQEDSSAARSDSAFHALQTRGQAVMGVDQYTSAHRFQPLPDGGRIELQREVADSAGIEQIRKHLNEIVRAFQAGDFRTPAVVHAMKVPGTAIMAAKRSLIRYEFRPLPRGGEVRIVTSDPEVLSAVHEFLAFQGRDHRTGDAHQH